MKFFEPNEKRTTIAVYVFLVALFCVFCVTLGVNISVFSRVFDFIGEVLKPIFYGLIIAFAIHPLVHFIETKVLGNRRERKIGFRHFLSVILAFLIVIAIIVLIGFAVIPEMGRDYAELVSGIMGYIDSFEHRTAELITSLTGESVYIYKDGIPDLRPNIGSELFSITLRNNDAHRLAVKSGVGAQVVKTAFDKIVQSLQTMISESLPSIFASAVTIITEAKNVIIGIVLALYILIGEKKHIERIHYIVKAWLPDKAYRYTMWLVRKSKTIFRDYIVVRILDGVIIGVLMFICLFMFQTKYSLFLAVLMGAASFFPFIGPIVGIAAGTLILLLVDPKYALFYLIVSVIVNLLDSRYIEPFLNAGREDNLPAIWVFASIVFMGGLFGIVGILIGIPLAAFIYSCIKAVCERQLRRKGLSDKTQTYIESVAAASASDIENIEEGTEMSTYLTESRDDAQHYTDMKEKLSKRTDKIKAFFKRKKK